MKINYKQPKLLSSIDTFKRQVKQKEEICLLYKNTKLVSARDTMSAT